MKANSEPGSAGSAIVGPTSEASEGQLPTSAPATAAGDVDKPNPLPTPDPTVIAGNLGQYPEYGRDPNWSWVAGEFKHTQIQGGCDYILYDPTSQEGFNGMIGVVGAIQGLRSGDSVVLLGYLDTGPKVMCPGEQFFVQQVLRR